MMNGKGENMLNYCKGLYKNIRFELRDLLYNSKNRNTLCNTDFTIISNDCTAGCVYKDLKVRTNTVTRNFYFNADDYIKFCQNLDFYLSLVPEQYKGEYQDEGSQYLMASLGDLKLFLVHIPSIEDAQKEWKRRRERINKNNIFFLMNDRNFCTEKQIKEFDELPYKNKICFTHIPYNQYKSTFYITGSEKKPFLDPITNYVHFWWIKRYYDQFDFVDWLNKGFNQ